MHAVGLHSALAIKRQRKRRDEQQRAKERRYSSQSCESGTASLKASTASLYQHYHSHNKRKMRLQHSSAQRSVDSKTVTSIGMLHIGIVFLILGVFLLISELLPTDKSPWKTKTTEKWWNELLAVGILAVIVGTFLIILNRFVTRKEENDLEEYVQRQLTRSKSGHRLEKDLETGGLTTKRARHAKSSNNSETPVEVSKSSQEISISSPNKAPENHRLPFAESNNHTTTQSAIILEKITEENTIISNKT